MNGALSELKGTEVVGDDQVHYKEHQQVSCQMSMDHMEEDHHIEVGP
jgi:hypothetical protein